MGINGFLVLVSLAALIGIGLFAPEGHDLPSGSRTKAGVHLYAHALQAAPAQPGGSW